MAILLDGVLAANDLILLAVALTVAFSVVRFFNIAQVDYATVGAFLALDVSRYLPLGLAIPVALVLTGLFAVALHALLFRRIADISPTAAMIGSLGVALMIRSAMELFHGIDPHRFDIALSSGSEVMGVWITQQQVVSLLLAVVILAVLFVFIRTTAMGRAIRAVSANPSLASACGLNSSRVVYLVVFITGAIAGMAGVLLGMKSAVDPNMANLLLLPAFGAAIAGGLGVAGGAIASALIIGIATSVANWFDFGWLFGSAGYYMPTAYMPAIGFGFIVLALLVRPQGIFTRRVRDV